MNSKKPDSISNTSSADRMRPNEPLPLASEKAQNFQFVYNNAPGFKKFLQRLFPEEQITDKMAAQFQQSMMKMIQSEIHRDMRQHKKVQEEIKRRINEG